MTRPRYLISVISLDLPEYSQRSLSVHSLFGFRFGVEIEVRGIHRTGRL